MQPDRTTKYPQRMQPLQDLATDQLLLHELYDSIQGESSFAGLPCTFIRTTACNLRCSYCDTAHAFFEGTVWSLEAVLQRVAELRHNLVEVTGGEPLLQPAVLPLLHRLCEQGYRVLLETSGALDIGEIDPRVVRIVDLKTPSSGEAEANLLSNLDLLTAQDQLKVVVGDRDDYEWAKALLNERALTERCTVLFGTVFGKLAERELARWILEDNLPVRMQVQLHKYIWDAKQRGV